MPFLKNIFKKQISESKSVPAEQNVSQGSEDSRPEISKSPRIVIEAPTISSSPEIKGSCILIKAQPVPHSGQCRFLLNRELFEGYSWFFSSSQEGVNSPLAEAIFSVDENICDLLVHGSTFTITCRVTADWDWQPLARKIGQNVRELLESKRECISQEIKDKIPAEDVIREQLQSVIDSEINPGVASHGGEISLEKVEGNTVTINMGGGCQGCSSAALTLKGGIESSFRQRVPGIGAILDATDHTAGTNPYFS